MNAELKDELQAIYERISRAEAALPRTGCLNLHIDLSEAITDFGEFLDCMPTSGA